MRKLLITLVSALAMAVGAAAMAEDAQKPETKTQQPADKAAGTTVDTGSKTVTLPNAGASTQAEADKEVPEESAEADKSIPSHSGAASAGEAGSVTPGKPLDDGAATAEATSPPATAVEPSKLEPALGTPAPAATMRSPLPPGAGLARLMNATIVNAEGEEIAEIRDYVLGADAQIEQVVIQFGDILGFGGKTTTLQLGQLHATPGEENRFIVNMDKEELKALPDYEEKDGRWMTKG
ncbi:hypothetical protein SH611_00350 [Geminicoccaceae bacterium 1502E]|nr:hypothetical protein [Geminicoccaceae bacterium 1502E]